MTVDVAPPADRAARAFTRTEASPALIVALFAAALVPLFTTPLLPFIDLYNHLARYFVLAHLGESASLRADYASNWGLLPNIGVDIIGTALVRVVPPTFAAQAVVVLLFAVQFGGVLAFNRALTGRTALVTVLLLVPLLYSYILNWGFANFLFGLGLVFAAAAWWWARRGRLAVALPVACLLAVVIFFAHGLCFALYGILVVSLEVGRVLTGSSRRPRDFVVALAPVAAQAVIPVILFVLAPISNAGGVTSANASIARLAAHGELGARLWQLVLYRLTTIVRVEEGPALWFDALTLAVQAAVVVWLIARRRAAITPAAWPAIAAAIILVVVVPPALFGVGYVADRMPLFLALLVVGALAVGPGGDGRERAASAVLGVVAVVRLAAIAFAWQVYARDFAAFERVAPLVPRGALVVDVVIGGAPRASATPRCSMYRPLLISHYGAIGPLFADEVMQPLRLTGRLQAAIARLPFGRAAGDPRPSYYTDYVANAGPAGFDYLIVCNAAALPRPLPPGVVTVARTPRFDLLRLPHPSAAR